ncbi:MAG: methyltransferase [Gammaproteobacteria bacterium RIFCSPLOWO2_02_FULL_52_10]|nr:MAG: methyltransferase [Gammaproteobacteria bacterium RIFCSPLOWO2_02_FULL_52_10]OGT85158.1 MAG: methyltransferase [Gammaproteobacteria bacterium RIFCSPLOWO2_12_FULL_52_10]
MVKNTSHFLYWLIASTFACIPAAFSQEPVTQEMDNRIDRFLDERSGTWRDWNVPPVDGRTLHDLIIKNNFTRALEIGTSTGHSAIWISKALNRTGGKLITIEIDEGRYEEALTNFQQAGVSHLIDARLADAHQLVYELGGPFDFVFSDADKEWYQQYMEALLPKLAPGGCFVAHNVSRRWNSPGIASMLDYARSRPDLETTLDSAGAGMSISCRKQP